jgi:NhaA family Na+:H+ antiporter
MNPIKHFFKQEQASGILIGLAAVLGLVISNSALHSHYEQLLEWHLSLGFGQWQISKSLLHWIDDGLMVIFFLIVGLELKREITDGVLSNPRHVVLPIIGALGGMIVPTLIFAFLNRNHPDTLGGWAIPMATDIAFALGAVALLGKRIPVELKVFLLTLAIVDDLGAILVIAIFQTSSVSTMPLLLAGVFMLALILCNRLALTSILPYLLLGVLLWLAVLQSGVHATIAGVLLGFLIPSDAKAVNLEKTLHPWVAFGILPLFALTNAGVSLSGIDWAAISSPLALGVTLGLFIGKPLGVFGFCWGSVRLGLAALPAKYTWAQLFGIAVICGIGFTMSLFIGSLAFERNTAHLDLSRISILLGSTLSLSAGLLILSRTQSRPSP